MWNPYVRFANLLHKNKEILYLPKAQKSERSFGRSLGISHLESPVFSLSEPDNALLLVEAASFHVTNPTKTPTFQSTSFYRGSKTILTEPNEIFRNYADDIYTRLESIMNV